MLRAPRARLDHEVLILPRVAHLSGSWEERRGRLVWFTANRPHHDGFTARSVVFCSLLFSFIVINGMDAVTTVYGTSKLGGWQWEGNPLLRWIGMRFKTVGFLVYKTLGVTVVVMGMWLMHRGFSRAAAAARAAGPRRSFLRWRLLVEVAAGALVVMYAAVVVSNTLLIMRLL